MTIYFIITGILFLIIFLLLISHYKLINRNSGEILGLCDYGVEIEKDIRELKNKTDYKICEVCGCLIVRESAAKGKPEIRNTIKVLHNEIEFSTEKEYIYYPYYCKKHKPARKKKTEFEKVKDNFRQQVKEC